MQRKIGSHKRRSTKSKPTGRRTHRRRRISGTKDIMGAVTEAAGLGVGAVAGRELNTIMVKFMPSFANNPLISGALQVAAGYILPKVVKGQPFVANIGKGMMANGVMVMVVSTGIISGTRDKVSYRLPGLNGTRHLPVVNGTYLPVVNGAGLPTNRTNRPTTRKMRVIVR